MTEIIDDIKAPSIVETKPEFSIHNIFKPTPKSRIIAGMIMKSLGITILGAAFATTNLWVFGTGILLGGLGELLILLSKEEPLSALQRAAEDMMKQIPSQLPLSAGGDHVE